MSGYVGLFVDPLEDALRRFGSKAPQLCAALLLLLVGLFAARALRTIIEKAFERGRLDDYTAKVGINEVFAHLGFGKSPAYALSFLVYWFILFVFIVSAANAVNMTVVSELLEKFALFLPNLIVALLILFGGLLFARFLSGLVSNAAASNGIAGGTVLGKTVYAVVLVFAAMTALSQLRLKIELVTSAVEILLASAGLAAALAFGLGGRDAAAEIIRGFLNKGK